MGFWSVLRPTTELLSARVDTVDEAGGDSGIGSGEKEGKEGG